MALPSDTRDQRGRFLPGCAPGPGRPTKAVEERYREALHGAVSPEEWAEACRAVLRQAKDGNVQAFRTLAGMLVPKGLSERDEEPDEVVTIVLSEAAHAALLAEFKAENL